MKFLRHILLAVLAFSFLVTSCVDPLELSSYRPSVLQDYALAFSPSVLGATLVTKADGDETTDPDPLGENTINTLDIYVYKQSGTAWVFFKRYNLQSTAEKPITSLQDIVLEPDWRNATPNYEAGVNYRTYVIANSRQPENVRKSDLSEANLLALKFPVSDTDPTHIECDYDIVRLKGSAPTDESDLHIANKDFVMDGVVESWRLVNSSEPQYITKYTSNTGDDSGKYHQFELNRAAAKFDLELTFGDFIKSVPDPDAPTDENKRVITKIWYPSFKFSRFMTATYDIAQPTSWSDFRDNLWDSDTRFNFTSQEEIANTDPKRYTYKLTTYSYAYSWGPAEGAEVAPSLTFSVGYSTCKQIKNNNGVWEDVPNTDSGPEYHYYRIPFIDLSSFGDDEVQGIKRNHHYSVKATILSKGATPTDPDDPASVSLKYKVIPWPSINSNDVTEVEGAELLYFTADTEYTLRGENTQTIKLDYFTPRSEVTSSGSPVIYKYEPVISNVHVYYKKDPVTIVDINSYETSSIIGTYSNSNTKWEGKDVVLQVLPEPAGGGQVYISSVVLANRAVKYIEFDATVTFSTSQGSQTITQTVKHHYKIVHFPLDNIQSVLGAWSSRWNGQSSSTIAYYRPHFYRELGAGYMEVEEGDWVTKIGNNNNDRKNANSEDNPINGCYATGGRVYEEEYGNFWTGNVTSINTPTLDGTTIYLSGGRTGVFSTWSTSYSPYDYVESTEIRNGNAFIKLYRYEKYYMYVDSRIEYSYSRNGDNDNWGGEYTGYVMESCSLDEYNAADPEFRYYEATPNAPSVENGWVDWERVQNGQTTGTTCSGYGYSSYISFTAKFWGDYYHSYANNYNYCYNISYNSRTRRYSGSRQSNLDNNHMYIIQISNAGYDNDGNPVIIGRPVVNDDTHMSNDMVVSPAFMIASQLGAVGGTYSYSENGAIGAANQCANYMEVSKEGRRFVNWRLPTKAEISYIVEYQKNDQISNASGVFSDVVTGHYYYTLDGEYQTTNYDDDSSYFVRCVRDLTPEEVAELNSSGNIVNAPY